MFFKVAHNLRPGTWKVATSSQLVRFKVNSLTNKDSKEFIKNQLMLMMRVYRIQINFS
jgi:hypothetical protein